MQFVADISAQTTALHCGHLDPLSFLLGRGHKMNQASWHLILRNIQGIVNTRNQEFLLILAYLELLNKVWGLEGCPHFYPLPTDRSVRFDFTVTTVLQGSSGDRVSFYTTVGGRGGSEIY